MVSPHAEHHVLRAAQYIRVSSEEQAMHGLSLAAQREALGKYARDHDMKVIDLYADEGITARKKYRNRAEFMRMLSDVKAGKLDVILFIKLDRWFRNVSDYYEVQKVLDDNNVKWVATEERYDTTTANGRLNLNIRLSIAQDESDRTAERIKFVFEGKKQRGEVLSGKVPLGYVIKGKRLEIDPDKAEIAQDIFRHYIDSRSVRDTRKYVLDTYGLYYVQTGMRALLQNQRYIGRAHGADDFCKPLITEDQFKLAQEIIAERAQRCSTDYPDRVYIFSGLVFCAECGNRLSGKVAGGKYVYYRCTKYDKMHLCNHKKHTSELYLENWLLTNLATQFDLYDAELSSAVIVKKPVDIAKVKAKMSKLKDLYLNDLIDHDEYEHDYRALRELLLVEAELEPPKPIRLDWIRDVDVMYRQLSRTERKAFWSRTASKIVIDAEDHIRVYPASFSP